LRQPVAYPFRRAAGGRVALLDWGVRPATRDDLIPDWDPGSNVGLSVRARVDMAGVIEDTCLGPDAPLALTLTWSCTATHSSGVLRSERLDAAVASVDVNLWGEIAGVDLAQAVTVSVTLHLSETIARAGRPLAPRLVGSGLWRESKTFVLEGEGARFPMETRAFASTMLFPAGAAWFLDWSADVPTDTFLGSVRLFLNSDHPAVEQLLAGSGAPEVAGVESLLRFDIARQLIVGALNSAAFLDEADFEAGSVGHHLRGLLAQTFPGRTATGLAQEMRQRPGHFESLLQDRLRFLAHGG